MSFKELYREVRSWFRNLRYSQPTWSDSDRWYAALYIVVEHVWNVECRRLSSNEYRKLERIGAAIA